MYTSNIVDRIGPLVLYWTYCTLSWMIWMVTDVIDGSLKKVCLIFSGRLRNWPWLAVSLNACHI